MPLRNSPEDWSVTDVGTWLESIGMKNFASAFVEQQISGQDLLELTEADLLELGIRAIGQRKTIQRHISDLSRAHSDEFGGIDSNYTESSETLSDSHSVNLSEGSSSTKAIKCKCYYRKDIRVFNIPANSIDYRSLLNEIREDYNRTLYLFYEDEEGDLIKIGSDRQLKAALTTVKKGVLKLTLQRRKKERSKRVSKDEQRDIFESHVVWEAGEMAMLDTLVDGCIVISSDGYIEFFNKAAEKIFGYSQTDVIGKNVNTLMSGMYAARHDSYIQNYHRTGAAKIIGTTRTVLGKHKDGRNLALELSISECKTGSRHTFTGMLKLREGTGSSNEDFNFSLLDSLLEPVICIDNVGKMLYVNSKALAFFDYPSDQLIGRNINMLMPMPHRENHSYYLAEYARTGVSTVIGKTRDTVCELADGSIKPIQLSVTENRMADGSKRFIGTITERKANTRKVSPLIQQRQVIETLATPAIIIDSTGIIQAFNNSALKALGYSLEEVMGNNVSLIVGGPHGRNHDQYIRNYLDSGIGKVIGKDRELSAKTKSGREVKILLTVTEHKDEGSLFFTGMFFSVRGQVSRWNPANQN